MSDDILPRDVGPVEQDGALDHLTDQAGPHPVLVIAGYALLPATVAFLYGLVRLQNMKWAEIQGAGLALLGLLAGLVIVVRSRRPATDVKPTPDFTAPPPMAQKPVSVWRLRWRYVNENRAPRVLAGGALSLAGMAVYYGLHLAVLATVILLPGIVLLVLARYPRIWR